MKKTINISVELPSIAGFQYTGEYRFPKEGEHILSNNEVFLIDDRKYYNCYHILIKHIGVKNASIQK